MCNVQLQVWTNIYIKFFKRVTLILVFFSASCKDYQKNKSHLSTPDVSIKSGKQLAIRYCGSCHQLPDPSQLDSRSWENGVLPEMGPRLGIFFYGFKQYPSAVNDTNIGKKFYPSKPLLTFTEWQNIIDYYTATSPDSLIPAKKPIAIENTSDLFKPRISSFLPQNPTISFLKITSARQLFTCDVLSQKLFRFNQSLSLQDSFSMPGAITDIIIDSNKFILCNTGILNPNNGKFGEIISAHDNKIDSVLFKGLMRPVQINAADLNTDGKQDLIICEFGNLKGALSWLENAGNNTYVRHVLRAFPGAIKTYTQDYNHDRLPDIWALFSQGDEGVFLFTNKGNGIFEQKEVLSFPPYYGSSSFELDDFNKDGFPDIVYTCGDNADYSSVLKPYHGVYIFMNDGKNNFTQKYFFPVNGCYKAMARDFDNDGDLDIATIAFFADYEHQPEEGFVYLKNKGNMQFKPYTLAAAKNGRWLTMDAGDLDGDGKIDLVLGNFSVGAPMLASGVNWKIQSPFLVLKNIQ